MALPLQNRERVANGSSSPVRVVEKCVLSDDGKTRTLSLKGGGTIVETLVSRDDIAHSYTYG
jgi:hypothetical protein